MVYEILILLFILSFIVWYAIRDRKKEVRKLRAARFTERLKLICDFCKFERTPESFAKEFEEFPKRFWFSYNDKPYCPTCNEARKWQKS